MASKLAEYQRKRRFDASPEPAGKRGAQARPRHDPERELHFVVQEHHARRLHYDFRLELDGVLKSWAVPKGPSTEPAEKRLAVHVEDHPLDYAGFEGEIPPGHYGAGSVRIDDQGVWRPDGGIAGARRGYREGKLSFELDGHRLHGRWSLVRTHLPERNGKSSWLLIKARDEQAGSPGGERIKAARKQPATAAAKRAGERAETHGEKHAEKHAEKRGAPPPRGKRAADRAGRREALPATLAPQLATLVAAPPEGEDWRYEMKFDGYRVLIRIAGRGRRRSVQVFTREGKDWSAKFRRQCAALADLPVNNAWLDAEAVVLDARGLPDFGALQQALSAGEDAAIVFFVFDLPFLDGRALADLPLDTRRERLAACFGGAGRQAVQLSPTLEGEPAELLAAASRAGLEGLIGKRADSPYRAGRSASWIKLKCRQRQEFVIGGFSEPRGSRSGFGALLLGVHERPAQGRRRAGGLAYVGRVGTGFDRRALDAIAARLRKIERSDAPFAVPPAERGDAVHWVEPRLVAECEFAGWTADGLVRQAAFIGLREDKPAGQIVRETAAPAGGQPTGGRMRTDHQATGSRSRGKAANHATGRNDDATVAGVRVTHPERVVDTESGLRKIDVVRYYAAIAEHLLPQLAGRPVSLVRYMKGIDGPSFFQKHAGPRGMGFVTRHPGLDPGHDALITLDDREALVGAAQFDALEFHTWNACVDRIERPDRLVFDLDPDPALPWRAMIEAAQALRALLDALGLPCFCKTSGGKGLHLVVPITRHASWDQARDFSQAVAQHLAGVAPERFSAKMGAQNRKGRIFVDYLRNGRGASTVAAWSARARPGMGVSVPIDWDELPGTRGGAQWTIAEVPQRLASLRRDPWDGYEAARRRLTAAMRERLGKL
ncbi:DNA ligase D [Burkholderia gladioli]|uniref:DNA ligase (ATP) n=1 Tax=Burkholderia gladioli TaxID=28095 RepID=A0AAW3EU77_BURGA|nr:DNA ligase D [Burkholderia gladioli]AJW99862.1 DNA ligase D [Burkholderia gladioli]ASD78603.1 ATP-dependent DNA ligase [Burkholderia gladioli pv. gladioli]AWY56155.1 ATP-dependent DNA ligase [Burkholderia gladioli pv. gladioli]KGC10294.1 DNA ligase D [Burkholderia gladioli]SPV11068.1 DNA primase, small subunit [Burkholderia gladioli]